MANQLYRAGAGAGKTTTLTRCIEESALKFRETHGRFPNFVVTTFTRKATQELRERLLLRALEKGDMEYLEFVNSTHHLLISTIHGVLSTFLSRHGHRFGFDPNISFITSGQERKLEYLVLKEMMGKTEGLRELLEVFSAKKLIEALHDASLRMSEVEGYSHYSAEELKELFNQKLLVLRKKAQEIDSRLEVEGAEANWQKYSAQLAYALTLVSEGKQEEAKESLKGVRKPSFSEKSKIGAFTNSLLQELKDDITDLFGVEYSVEVWKTHGDLTEKFLSVARDFQERCRELKRRRGVMSMADLEIRAREALRAHPEVGEAFGQEWDYWFVDEYQDTSPMQEEIIRYLQADRPCFVVGDPQQSIYLFRGARSEVFLRKEQEYQQKGFALLELKDNYRSREELVRFFNFYFGSLKKGFHPMNAKVELASKIAPVTFALAEDLAGEIEHVCHWVKRLMSEGVAAEKICILAKTNDLLRAVAEEFKNQGIPHRLHASGGFGARPEVREATSLLKFLLNPHDNLNLLSMLRSPFFKVEDEVLEKLRVSRSSLWEELLKTDLETKNKLQGVLTKSEEVGIYSAFVWALKNHAYFEAARIVDSSGVRESNLFKLIQNLREQQKKQGFNYLSFIDDLDRESIEESDSDAVPAVEPKRVNLMTIHASKGLQFQHLTVLGFSKGKRMSSRRSVLLDEDKRKVVVGFPNEEGSSEIVFPGREILEESFRRELEEGDRLLYVAFTRAIESLFVTFQIKAEKGSWRESCPLLLSEGEHVVDGVKYSVVSKVEAREISVSSREATSLPKISFSTHQGLRQVSVTALLSDSSSSGFAQSDVLKSVDRIRVGIELHEIFERLAIENSDEGYRRAISQLSEQQAEAVKFVFNQNEIPFKQILKSGRAEFGFVYRFEGFRIEGKVDLFGIHNDELWIVDYKTGSSRAKDKAFSQLRIYSLALMEMFKKKGAKLAVVFPFESKIFVEEVTDKKQIADQLKALLFGKK